MHGQNHIKPVIIFTTHHYYFMLHSKKTIKVYNTTISTSHKPVLHYNNKFDNICRILWAYFNVLNNFQAHALNWFSKSLTKINKCMYAKCVYHILFIKHMFQLASWNMSAMYNMWETHFVYMLLLILLSDFKYFNVSNNPSMFSYVHYWC